MTEVNQPSEKISTPRAISGIILSIIIMGFAQFLSFSLSSIPQNLGVPIPICNILMGIIYVGFAYAGIALLCTKFLKTSLSQLRIPKVKLKSVWVAAAILMPLLVVLLSLLVKGHWEVNTFPTETTLAMVTATIAFYGLATGIVEEIVFRGVILGCIEKRWNIKIAIIIPSVLFGLLHIIGNELDFISTLQLLVAGTVVGILFSLIAVESHSIWNNALVHGVWNMVMIGSLLHIGDDPDNTTLVNYVLESKSFLLTGGDFGIEASVQSIAGYLLFIGLAVALIRKKGSGVAHLTSEV